jgi:hypothetical protein
MCTKTRATDPRELHGRVRPVQFYKPTRPQAPKYAKAPALQGHVECSICRGLFLEDTDANRDAHRRWHKMWGNAHMPCTEAQEAGMSYAVLLTCSACTEDICPCVDCYIQHTVECSRWAAAWELFETGDEDGAQAAMDAILDARVGDAGKAA